MSSIKLLRMIDCSNQNGYGMIHIDGTYKITRNKFPLIVFGRTDLRRQFHPISFMVTSHEDNTDFSFFYSELIKILNILKINFSLYYLMQDACQASYNAEKTIFQNTTILMCWYHLMANVKLRLPTIDSTIQNEIMSDINKFHFALNHNEYVSQYNYVMSKWDHYHMIGKKGIKEFKEYFNSQWVYSSFNLWQLYTTPPGYATGNGPIESFNNQIKSIFTLYVKLSMHDCLTSFMVAIIQYYSVHTREFEMQPITDVPLRQKATNYLPQWFNLNFDHSISHIVIQSNNEHSNYTYVMLYTVLVRIFLTLHYAIMWLQLV